MFETEGKIARLEAGAVAAAQDIELHAFGRHRHGVAGQRRMSLAVAVIQELDGEPVPGIVHRGGRFGDPDGQHSFIADRQLHQHMGQLVVAQRRRDQFGAFAVDPHPGQDGQLNGQGADSNKDAGQSELQGEGKTVHGEGSGPQGLVRRNRWSFRVYEYAGSSKKGHPRRPGARHGTGRLNFLRPARFSKGERRLNRT